MGFLRTDGCEGGRYLYPGVAQRDFLLCGCWCWFKVVNFEVSGPNRLQRADFLLAWDLVFVAPSTESHSSGSHVSPCLMDLDYF